MSGIHGQRCQQREYVGDEFFPQQFLLFLFQVDITTELYSLRIQQLKQLSVNPVLLLVDIPHDNQAFLELFQWCPAIN